MQMDSIKNGIRSSVAFASLLVLVGCQTAPITGRNQFIIVSESQAVQLGADAYKQIRTETPISRDPTMNQAVQDAGRRIAAVAHDPGYDWEFTVFEDADPNAFALPGGKVGVNTGLFQVAKNEAQLAAVMAHEVAHAIARHSAERMSQQIAIQGGLAAAGAASATAAQYSGILAQAATLAVVLPFGRNQESEADEIGLMYMAEAGYDPRAAVELWQNFASFGGDRPPEFLSTHPSPGTRIDRLNALMPRALEIYRANQQ